MPELPEVEHVVRALQCAIAGRRIVAADLKLARLAPSHSRTSFSRKLKGAAIKNVGRRGKFILVHLLNPAAVLMIHLRMTGKFVRLTADQSLPKHAHVIFYLDDDRRLVFCDMRQFGRLKIVNSSRLENTAELRSLAPEPLLDGFSVEYLHEVLGRSRRTIKTLLLDQTRVLGLGNIYASEALFLARINPFAVAATISKTRTARLFQAIRDVLEEAIESGSTLRIDLEDFGAPYFGSLEKFWRVYERAGVPCVTCGTRIRRVVQAARSTYFCPRCQRR